MNSIHSHNYDRLIGTRSKPISVPGRFCPALLAAIMSLWVAAPAMAQTDTGSAKDTARNQDVISSSGVSYATGAFSYRLPLVNIGGGEFPRGLSYGLWYSSGSARLPNRAWTHNLAARVSRTLIDDPAADAPEPDGKPHPEWQTWLYNAVIGQRSESFEKYNSALGVGEFKPVTKTGSSLTYSGGSSGYFTYIGSRGEILQFRPVSSTLAASMGDFWKEPDGTVLQYRYTSDSMSVENNLGWALFMEPAVLVQSGIYDQEICVLNLTQHYLPSVIACPTGVPTAKVRSTALTPAGYTEVTSVTMPDAGVYNFTYATSTRGGVTRRALGCIKRPGSSSCSVTNGYDTCDQRQGHALPGNANEDPSWTGSRDRVTQQIFESGENISYSYVSDTGCRNNGQVTVTDALNAVSIFKAGTGGLAEARDPLHRLTLIDYTGYAAEALDGQDTLVNSVTNPEGDRIEYTYDARGNVTVTRRKAKPGSGLSDIVTSATFPTTCTYRVTCNQPTTRTDARGGVTDYTYDQVHGGILTETGPAPASAQPRPQTRYTYAQRYAWVSNGSGGYAQAASPVWVLTEKSLCKTSASTGNPSAPCTTTGDEVKTTYDYGPDSGPNNLLLRGIVEDAGGLNLRTCYGYDSLGRKISETKPRAGLTGCP